MYERGMGGAGQTLEGLFDSIVKVAGGITQGAQAAQQIASGQYQPYIGPGGPPVLYGSPPPPSPQSSNGSGLSTTLLLGSAAVLAVVLVMMRRGRR